MKKILNNKFLIVLVILTIVKLILCTLLPTFTIKNLFLDDALMLDGAKNICNGDWLGEYSDSTLIKGMFFPLLLALFHLMHIPVSFGLSLIYIISCIFFCFVIKDIFKNKKYIYIVYLLLLFNPISFASETFERLYRNSLGPTQILFIFGFLYGVYKNSGSIKKMFPHLIGLGFSISSMMLTREDYIWIFPAIILVYILIIIKEKNKNIFGLLIPIIIVILCINIVGLVNKHYYGVKMINEMNESSYKKAYLEILKIKPKENIYRVSVPKSTLDIAFENSKTFNNLSEYISDYYKMISQTNEPEIIDGYIIWYLRAAAESNGYYKDFKTSEKFWNSVYRELKEARESGKYETRVIIPSIFVSPLTKDNLINFVKELPSALKYIFTYDGVKTYSFDDIENSKWTSIYINVLEEDKFYLDYNQVVLLDIKKTEMFVSMNYKGVSGIFNIVTVIYKYLSIIINILGILCFIYLVVKKQFKNLLIPIIMIISFIVLVCGVTYTHVSAFEAIRYFYLGPAYIILILFSIVSILLVVEGANNEGINNINALFKRGR